TRAPQGQPPMVLAELCYEISRRIFQTGVVVVVSMLMGENAALIYSLIFSVVALVVHQAYWPFLNNSLNRLQLFILGNQFIIQTILIMFKLGSDSSTLGTSVLLLQMGKTLLAENRRLIAAVNNMTGKRHCD
ncbi:hypothetical protein CYMTET_20792, partial [Cymbomonas tetramitiformis]